MTENALQQKGFFCFIAEDAKCFLKNLIFNVHVSLTKTKSFCSRSGSSETLCLSQMVLLADNKHQHFSQKIKEEIPVTTLEPASQK